jgi:hypothetical protein
MASIASTTGGARTSSCARVSVTTTRLIAVPASQVAFNHRLIRFRHFTSVSLALVSLDQGSRNRIPAFPQRSPPRLFTAAACCGLGSAPDCRTQRARLHLSYSCAGWTGVPRDTTADTNCRRTGWHLFKFSALASANYSIFPLGLVRDHRRNELTNGFGRGQRDSGRRRRARGIENGAGEAPVEDCQHVTYVGLARVLAEATQ